MDVRGGEGGTCGLSVHTFRQWRAYSDVYYIGGYVCLIILLQYNEKKRRDGMKKNTRRE